MPEKKHRRREQQHLRQQQSRTKTYTAGGKPGMEAYKPGFPMNIFGNVKLFALIGVVVAIVLVVSAVLIQTQSGEDDTSAIDDLDTPTPTATIDPSATPSPTAEPTEEAKQFAAAAPVIDAASKEYTATVKTSMGDFTIRLYADQAPNTVNSFVFLAQQDYFDNTPVHRVVAGFVVQMGDPTGTGSGGPGYQTEQEPNEIRNEKYVISMAKAGSATNFGSQFFINLKSNTALDFDNGGRTAFYPWGEVESGFEVVDAMGAVATNPPIDGKPVDPITILDVVISEQDKS